MIAPRASDGASIHPAEACGLRTLQRLACESGAAIHRSQITLAGQPRPAYLAVARDGRLLAAVLIDDALSRHELAHARATQ